MTKTPFLYLRDVLTKLPTMTNQNDLTPVFTPGSQSGLPGNWQPA